MASTDWMKICGGFGRFQFRQIISMFLITIPQGFFNMMSVFICYTPPHRCLLSTDNKTSGDQLVSTAIPWDNKTFKYDRCHRYTLNLNSSSGSDSSVIECDKGWYYDVTPGISSITTEFDLVCSKVYLNQLVPTMLLIGFAVGSIVGGVFADRFGRWPVYFAGNLIRALSVLMIAFSPRIEIILLLMFLQGAAGVVRVFVSVTICAEMIEAKHRGIASISQISSSCLGYMLLPLYAYYIPNWRWMSGALAVSSLLTVPLNWFVTESVPWLMSMKKHDVANKIIHRIAKCNGVDKTSVVEYLKQQETRPMTSDDVDEKRQHVAHMSYFDLIRHSVLRKRFVAMSFPWIAIVCGYYGISLNTSDFVGDRYINCFLIGLAEIPGNVTSFVLLRFFGGRKSLVPLLTFAGLFLIVIPVTSQVSAAFGIATAITAKLLITGSSRVIYVYTSEIFPTLVRNQAFAAFQVVCRTVTAFLAPAMPYLGDKVHPVFPFAVMGSLALVAAFLTYFMPEVKGKPLPDTMDDVRDQERYFGFKDLL